MKQLQNILRHYPIGRANPIQILQIGDEPEIINVDGFQILDKGDLVIFGNGGEYDYNGDMRLLLRPMSDLYRKIDGKIGIVELAKIAFRGNGYEYFKVKGKEVLFCSESATIYFTFYSKTFRFSHQNNLLEMIQWLFEHHYDIFDLIGQGEAKEHIANTTI